MNPESIKLYVEQQLARNERLVAYERTEAYWEDEMRLRSLWLRADAALKQEKQNELLLRIAIGIECLENLK